jgi:hypothetical protein
MTDWNKLKVVDLKAELKKRGLAQTGLKPALVARLTEAENGGGSESEATAQGDVGREHASTSSNTVSPVQETSDPNTEVLPDAPLEATSEPTLESSSQTIAEPDASQRPPNVESEAEPVPTQSTTIIELSQPPVQSQDSHQSALPSAEPQEILDDRQKRKRRSQSPPPSTSDSARKRARQEGSEVVTAKDDAAWVEKHNAVDSADVNADAMEIAPSGEGIQPGPTIVDIAKEEVQIQAVSGSDEDKKFAPPKEMDVDEESRPKTQSGEYDDPSRVRDSRFKDLFPTQQKAPALEKSSSRDSAPEAMDIDTDRVISPAVHPATSALYIRDFMRPLNPAQLKSYLASLATPPGHDTDTDIIVNFYLDPIRTHAFVSLTSVSAAARVRSAIHDRIWPDERTRKPLWADFVPAEKVDWWVEEEQSTTGGRASGKKWEVYYDVDEDRNVTATLQESSAFPRAPIRQPSGPGPLPFSQAPTKPRGIEGAPLGPRAATQAPRQSVTSNLKTLDKLFKATTAKPVLYFQPVSKELANKRLDSIDFATSKKAAGPAVSGEINRYTFEDGDVLVDRGPEIFPGIRPPPGYRGPASRTGSPRGGAYEGRDTYRGGPPDRRYDSYRRDRRDSRDRRY